MNQPDANGWGNFGVLDGHGGSQAARLGAQLLPLAMKKHTKGRKVGLMKKHTKGRKVGTHMIAN